MAAFTALRNAFIREALHRKDPPEVANADAVRIMQESEVWLHFIDNTPIGMAICSAIGDIGTNIGGVYTLPAFRGRGIAAHLVSGIAAMHTKPAHFICLMADQQLAHTNGLYQKLGFK